MIKVSIQNRKGQKMVVMIEQNDQQKGLAFVMHGLGGFKEQPHLQVIAEAFFENNYTVIRFDTTNTYGESEGSYEDATLTNYYEDLEDVINWASTQEWYREPFVLMGHSLGGISTALYAEKHPEKVKGLAPISTVVSGKLSLESPQYINTEVLKNWEETGIRETPSESIPGLVKRLKWVHVADRLKYDLLPEATKLRMPVLMIVGSEDDSTPEMHQRILYNSLPGPKQFHSIQNAPHTFRKEEHLGELKNIFIEWIKKLN
ncbi:MAG: alpha/beta hydrolase [Patescibacteria group bacterium]